MNKTIQTIASVLRLHHHLEETMSRPETEEEYDKIASDRQALVRPALALMLEFMPYEWRFLAHTTKEQDMREFLTLCGFSEAEIARGWWANPSDPTDIY